jgi:hypothetical protein
MKHTHSISSIGTVNQETAQLIKHMHNSVNHPYRHPLDAYLVGVDTLRLPLYVALQVVVGHRDAELDVPLQII